MDMKNYCKNCKKRDECTKLCKEAEEYASQDYVAIEEGLVDINIENREEPYETFWGGINLNTSERLKKAIIELHLDGKTVMEIAYHLPCSHQYISKIINKFK